MLHIFQSDKMRREGDTTNYSKTHLDFFFGAGSSAATIA
jgi:hypothetical protein